VILKVVGEMPDAAAACAAWRAGNPPSEPGHVLDDVLAAVDARAGWLGLSRSEYVRNRLAQDATAPDAWPDI